MNVLSLLELLHPRTLSIGRRSSVEDCGGGGRFSVSLISLPLLIGTLGQHVSFPPTLPGQHGLVGLQSAQWVGVQLRRFGVLGWVCSGPQELSVVASYPLLIYLCLFFYKAFSFFWHHKVL